MENLNEGRKKFSFTQKEFEHSLHGLVVQLLLPNGSQVLVRETNGSDDEILSSAVMSPNDYSDNIDTFLSNVIIEDIGLNRRYSPTEIQSMKLRNKYFILMAVRIISLGERIKFSHDWGGPDNLAFYDEELIPYLWDYTKEFPTLGQTDYFKYRIKPYETKTDLFEFSIESGKKLRVKYIDGVGERLLINSNSQNLNTTLLAREISLFSENGWAPVKNFLSFKSREMAEIRNVIEKYDEMFDGLVDIQNPKTKQWDSIPLLAIRDFFFPRGI